MVNLNDLVIPHSALQMVAASSINNRGEILGIAFVPETGDLHAAVLIPCDEHARGCGTDGELRERTVRSSPVIFSTTLATGLFQIVNPRHRITFKEAKRQEYAHRR